MAKGGVDAIRAEVLAERLGVTKGGFYRRFKDRQALLNAILESWADGRSFRSSVGPEREAQRRWSAKVADQTLFPAGQCAGHGDRACYPTVGTHRTDRSRGKRDVARLETSSSLYR